MLATLLDATMRGLIITAMSMPGMAGHRVQARPFGAVARRNGPGRRWGWAAWPRRSFEPDPAVQWDSDRIARVRQALSCLTLPDA